MLISEQHRKVVLNVKNIERVTKVIPTAKTIEYRGTQLVVVPHRNDESRVLRNLGFSVPPPITKYYDWQGKHNPYAHQEETAAFFTMNPRCFCLNGMGSGKTISTLWAFDYLRSIGAVNRMLIVAPLSTLERTWGDEIFGSFDDMSFCVLHGTESKRLKLLDKDYDVYIINHDGIKNKNVMAAIMARKDIDIVAVDEIASFRNASTQRWKALNLIAKSRYWFWGLTGTPQPKEPTDVWAQVKLVNPSNTTNSFRSFRDLVMRQHGPYKWVARDNAADVVSKAMQPAIRFSREDCIDLPPTTYVTRHAEMSDEQKDAYTSMLTKLIAEHNDNKILAVNEAVKANKLLQIAAGVLYTAEKETIRLDNSHRLEVLEEFVQGAEGKFIVFVPFTGALHAVTEFLRGIGYNIETIHGQTAKSDRDRIFGDFQKGNTLHGIVANPAAMAHGLTLTAADMIVWFSPPMSNEIYEQANMRIVRPGQKRNTLIGHIEGSTIERKAYERLQQRGKMQGILLELMKGEV